MKHVLRLQACNLWSGGDRGCGWSARARARGFGFEVEEREKRGREKGEKTERKDGRKDGREEGRKEGAFAWTSDGMMDDGRIDGWMMSDG